MKRFLFALLLLAGAAHAGDKARPVELNAYQRAALEKILDTVPPEHRETLRRDMAETLKGMPNDQVDMILNGFKGGGSAAPNAGLDGRKPAPKR